MQAVFSTRVDALRLKRELREQLFADHNASALSEAAEDEKARAQSTFDAGDRAHETIDVNEQAASSQVIAG